MELYCNRKIGVKKDDKKKARGREESPGERGEEEDGRREAATSIFAAFGRTKERATDAWGERKRGERLEREECE